MKISWLRQLSGKELTNEKVKDFKRIVGVQVLLILVSMFSREFLMFMDLPFATEISELLFFGILGVYVYFLWDTLRVYTQNRTYIASLLFIIMGIFSAGAILINPFNPILTGDGFKTIGTFIQGSLLAVESSVIYYTMREFFKRDLGLDIKLWGAASLYLMIGISFGSL